ncbi:hypothetical protein V1278_001838 [Bradyrhizobium sp. AZCC 1577]
MESDDFEAASAALPEGYSEGIYEGWRYGVSVRRSDDGRRNSLFARELAGTDIVSFNLYRLGSGNAWPRRHSCDGCSKELFQER